MKKFYWFYLSIVFLCSFSSIFSQDDSSNIHRVFTTSNFADVPNDHLEEYTKHLHTLLETQKTPFTFIHNGDLTTNEELKSVDWKKKAARISSLLSSCTIPNSKHIIVPGDRDWLNSQKGGWKYVKKLEKVVEENKAEGVFWTPGKGCIGPKAKKLSNHVLLIVINTQWWNHPYDKPGPTDADCKISRDADFLEELEDVIEEAGNTNIILAGHFPLESNGPYGGRSTLKQHLLPLPIIGSMRASYRKNDGRSEDISNERFGHIRKKLWEIVEETPNLIYLSGHEKNIEILKEEESFQINSGAAFATSFVRNAPNSLFKSDNAGVLELIYHPDGKVEYQMHQYTDNGFVKANKNTLLESACNTVHEQKEINHAFVPCLKDEEEIAEGNSTFTKTVKLVAGPDYKISGFAKLFLGKLYRDAWTTTIEVPNINLGTTLGGLTPLERGGGAQTQSLKLAAADGKEYVFRSVDKNPVQALPNSLKTDFFTYLAQQSTATQQPYGAMAVSNLLDHTEILHARPQLYALPDDARLGVYREEFSGMLGMLEDRPKKPKKGKPGSFDADEILRSYQLFTQLYEDHDNQMDKQALLNARVFDIWIGDRGRHEENFKWAGFKQNNGILYRPIPRDRDHAFSRLNGLFPWIIDQPWGLPYFEDFGYKIKDIQSLNYSARHLDRSLLIDATKEDWINTSKELRATFTDEMIEEAMLAMPKEIYENSSKEIAAQLKQRLTDLDGYIEKYYLLLAKEVDVWGSNKKEFFKILRQKDGSVTVTMYNLKSYNEQEIGKKKLYERTFHPKETKEIRIYGLGGKDIIEIEGESVNSILVRVFGGDGEDTIEDVSKVSGGSKQTLVYEKNKESKTLLGTEGKTMTPDNKNFFDYQRKIFTYNSYMPIPVISYNSTEGFGIGWGYNFTRQKFGKEDYSSKHSVGAVLNIPLAIQLNYSGRYHHVMGKWDVVTTAGLDFPNPISNFFGLGNETPFDQTLFDNDFYESQYNTYNFQAGVIKDFYKKSYFSAIAKYEGNNQIEPIAEDSFFDSDIDYFGKVSSNIAQLKLTLDIDFRDDPYFPKNGMRFFISHENGIANGDQVDNVAFGISEASLEGFISTKNKRHLTLGIKIGGGDSYGQIPFYNKLQLGQTSNLKGFYNQRFTGDASVYLNTELRWKLATIKNPVIPIEFGLSGFYDRGKVFLDGIGSNVWHEGYGFGIYLVPTFSQVALNLSVGFSEESEGLILFKLGSLLN